MISSSSCSTCHVTLTVLRKVMIKNVLWNCKFYFSIVFTSSKFIYFCPYSRVHIYWSLLVFFADIDYFCPDFSFTYWIFIILFCIRSLFRLISTPMENIFIDERIKSIEYLLVIEEILWTVISIQFILENWYRESYLLKWDSWRFWKTCI
jgi:hypothetical protein